MVEITVVAPTAPKSAVGPRLRTSTSRSRAHVADAASYTALEQYVQRVAFASTLSAHAGHVSIRGPGGADFSPEEGPWPPKARDDHEVDNRTEKIADGDGGEDPSIRRCL